MIRPATKHHYGGRKRQGSDSKKTQKFAQEAAAAPPLESQLCELARLGVDKIPRSRLAAARLLKRIKLDRGELR
jgi:hypothetical protein